MMSLRHIPRTLRAVQRTGLQLPSRRVATATGGADFRSTADALRAWPATRYTLLKNGIRVVSEPTGGETATVGVWIDTGSRYETEQNNGVAHFLEHMLFKGTAKRSQLQLEKEIENLGAHLNAYTSREQTVFYAKCFKNDVAQSMDILADILQNSKITPEAVERERGVILREAEEIANQPEEVIFDMLHETAYRDTALGRTILGPSENIERLTSSDIKAYVDTHYTADRMVIAGAGSIDHAALVKLAEEKFGSIPSTPVNGVRPNKTPARFTGSAIRARYDDMPFAHIAYAFPTAGWADPDNYPILLMQTLLGSWDKSNSSGAYSSSELIKHVAERHACNSVMAFNTQYSDTGLFGVHTVAEPEAVLEMMQVITEEITRLAYEVRDDRLAEAKNQLATNLLNSLDGSSAVCEELGRQVLTLGRRIHPLEAFQRIDNVDANGVKNAAKRFVKDKDFALASMGPVHEVPDYNWLRRRTFWQRV